MKGNLSHVHLILYSTYASECGPPLDVMVAYKWYYG